MDIQQLMFAVEVRKLAQEIQKEERAAVERTQAAEHPARRENVLASWDAKYPPSAFVKRAYREIAETLGVIKEQAAADSSAILNERLGLK